MAAPMEDRFLEAVHFAKRNLGVPEMILKEKQLEALQSAYNNKDCVAVLPTGYGKSLIFQLLPWIVQHKKSLSEPAIVIVVCPLNSIMQDQVAGLIENGVSSCFLNTTSSSSDVGKTYVIASATTTDQETTDEDSETENETSVVTGKDVDLESLMKGKYTIIYAHPETLVSNSTIGKVLRSKVYKKRVGSIVVDEVHMVTEWGKEFRTAFGKLSELNALFTDAVHMVVTASLTPCGIKDLCKELQLADPVIITMNPDRENIFIERKPRLSNIRKFDKFDDLISPICEDLKSEKSDFPVTIVYVDGLEAMYYCYQYIEKELGNDGYLPSAEHVPENRIFAQYHRSCTNRMKSLIVSDLRKPDPTIRLVLATVALGMGLDAPSITRIVHFRPPTSLENYMQEIGRAGRKGQKSIATVYFNKNDIASNRPGIKEEMVKFCNSTSCLRKLLLTHFGADYQFTGAPEECCSNCAADYNSLPL